MGALTGHTPASTYQDILQAGNAGVGVPAALQQIQDGLGNNTGLFLSQTQIGLGGNDIGIKRLAAAHAQLTDGGAGKGFLQSAGDVALNGGFTNSNGTLTATALSVTVAAGRSYIICGMLQVSNTTASEGFKCDFAGGAASATTFFMAATTVGSVVAGTVVSTALNGLINWTTVTGTDYIFLQGYLKVSGGGTFIMRAAENTTGTGTMTLGAGSWLSLADTAAL